MSGGSGFKDERPWFKGERSWARSHTMPSFCISHAYSSFVFITLPTFLGIFCTIGRQIFLPLIIRSKIGQDKTVMFTVILEHVSQYLFM